MITLHFCHVRYSFCILEPNLLRSSLGQLTKLLMPLWDISSTTSFFHKFCGQMSFVCTLSSFHFHQIFRMIHLFEHISFLNCTRVIDFLFIQISLFLINIIKLTHQLLMVLTHLLFDDLLLALELCSSLCSFFNFVVSYFFLLFIFLLENLFFFIVLTDYFVHYVQFFFLKLFSFFGKCLLKFTIVTGLLVIVILYVVYSFFFGSLHSCIYFLHLNFDCFVIIKWIISVPGVGGHAFSCSIIRTFR